MESSRPPTLKEAQRWLLIYDFFNAHEKATFEGWSSIDFENDLKQLGRGVWETENTLEIIEHLKEIAKAGKAVDVDEALVPPNIDELVSEHLAALKKIADTKPATGRTIESVAKWAKEEKLRQLIEALQTVVGKENAQKVAPILEPRLTEAAFKGGVITEDQLLELIRSTFLESVPQITNPLTVEEVALNIAKTTLGRRILPQGVEAIGVSRRVVLPRQRATPPKEGVPTESSQRMTREAQLLLRVSYLRASVVKQFFSQLGALSPLRLLNIVGGTSYANSHPLEAGVQSLLLRGVTIRLLREAITRLKEQTPGIAPNDPRVRTLEEIITAMEAYKSSRPDNYEKLERSAADNVEIYVAAPGEEVTPTPGKMLRLRSIVDQAGKFQFLRIDTLSLKKGIRSLPGIVGRAVSYPFLSAARVFFGKPAGGILHAFGGPRAVAVQQATFGVQKGVVNFAKGAFRQLGSFVSDVFTRPALGWLRWGLTGGFGLAAVSFPFPFSIAFGGMAGITGATQLAHSAPSAGPFLSGLRNRLGTGGGGGGSVGRSRFALGLPVIVLAPFLVILVLAFMVINGAQGTFQGIGGGGGVAAGEYVESPYINIEKTVSPKSSFQNDEIDTVATYTLVVSPKEDILKDVEIIDTVSLSNEGGSETLQKNSWPTVSEIKKGETWKQSYTLTIKNSYKDSVIANTVSVTASVSDSNERQVASKTQTIIVGNPPLSCPSGWPTPSGYITQGPCGSATHRCNVQAIDIVPTGDLKALATHDGVVVLARGDGVYGNSVEIKSSCGGKEFISKYSHLAWGSITVSMGQFIKKNQQVGTIDNSGSSSGPHIDYELRGIDMGPGIIPLSEEQWNTVYRCSKDEGCGIRW